MELLTQGLQKMQIELADSAQQQLLAYVALLAKWSKFYNLTTVREPENIISHHILDSLTLLPYLDDVQTVLDVGTGAGLPGIPLAIARPDISFKLIDSQQKKINFVQHVITSLKLNNVSAIWARIESLQDSPQVGMIVSRAFASLSDFTNLIAGLCDEKTRIIAMKGRREQVCNEQLDLPPGFKLNHIETVTVPGLDAERCVVFLTKQGD